MFRCMERIHHSFPTGLGIILIAAPVEKITFVLEKADNKRTTMFLTKRVESFFWPEASVLWTKACTFMIPCPLSFHNTLWLIIICEWIWEKGPLGTNFHIEIWSKISNQPQSGLFPDYCSNTNYYPLPTFWHKSDARACCCSSLQSVYFHPLDPPFIAWTGGVVTWSKCYRGNGGSSTSIKDRFSAWTHSQMKLKTAFDAGPSC